MLEKHFRDDACDFRPKISVERHQTEINEDLPESIVQRRKQEGEHLTNDSKPTQKIENSLDVDMNIERVLSLNL